MAIRRWHSQQGAFHWKRAKRGDQESLANVRGKEEESGDSREEIPLKNASKGVGPNPTDRAKMGVKGSILGKGTNLWLVEGGGCPLAICIAGANVNDHLLLEATLNAIVVERPVPTPENPQNLCLDKGYDNEISRQIALAHNYVAHIKQIGEEKKDEEDEKTHPARRWVVERAWGWLSRWRGLLIRWEKKPENYLANLKLACALLWIRRAFSKGSTILG
jgi:putative transposase